MTSLLKQEAAYSAKYAVTLSSSSFLATATTRTEPEPRVACHYMCIERPNYCDLAITEKAVRKDKPTEMPEPEGRGFILHKSR